MTEKTTLLCSESFNITNLSCTISSYRKVLFILSLLTGVPLFNTFVWGDPFKLKTMKFRLEKLQTSSYRTARTEENVDLVNDLVVSQENTPQTHRTVHEILIISRNVMKLPP